MRSSWFKVSPEGGEGPDRMLCSSLLGGNSERCRSAGDVVSARTLELLSAHCSGDAVCGCRSYPYRHWDPHLCCSAFPTASCPTAVGSLCGMEVSTRPVPSW